MIKDDYGVNWMIWMKLATLDEEVGQPSSWDLLQSPLARGLVPIPFQPHSRSRVDAVDVTDVSIVLVQNGVQALLGALDPHVHFQELPSLFDPVHL